MGPLGLHNAYSIEVAEDNSAIQEESVRGQASAHSRDAAQVQVPPAMHGLASCQGVPPAMGTQAP